MADNVAALMRHLRATARAGRACDAARDIALSLGISAKAVNTAFIAARKAKLISWSTHYCGPGVGQRRWVTLVADRLQTAKPVKFGRAYLRAQGDTSDLQKAKTALQKRGHYVWDAAVDGGPLGLVRVDQHLMAPADVIAFAGGV